MSPRSIIAFTCALTVTTVACKRPSDEAAIRLVEAYNQKLIEAFRTSDEQVMEGLVGDDEAKKLTGLIGVKYDMGITLDADLLDLTVLRVTREEDRVEVHTTELWHYRDRRIGSGETAGQESTDHYLMCYTLKEERQRWVVWRVRFEQEPKVGRRLVPNEEPGSPLHGGPARANGQGTPATITGSNGVPVP